MLVILPLLAHAYDNGAPNSRLPPLGWSSWVALGPKAQHPIFDYCDETNVKHAIDAFHAVGLYDAGYRHFHLDDCWAGGRNATGYLYPEAKHFPNGMAPVIAYAHKANLSFGLYTCAGNFTCVGHRPGSRDHWKQDAAVFAEWKVDVVKMDWCDTHGMHPKAAYGNMSAALNSTGRAIHLNMCEWGIEDPWKWGGKIAQSWRMSHDHTGVWSSTKQQIRSSSAIPAPFTGSPFAWNDMDMLETGNYEQAAHANGRESNMSAIEYRAEFSMWAISASPLVVTTPIMNCSEAAVDSEAVEWIASPAGPSPKGGVVSCMPWISDLQREILLNKEVIAINQDVTPQGRPLKDGDLSVWGRVLSAKGTAAIALYNEDDTPRSIGVDFAMLDGLWGATVGKVSVRDLWAKRSLGDYSKRLPPMEVAPHEAIMLKLTKL